MFAQYMIAGNCNLKYAQGPPAVSGREIHRYDEIVFFMEGNARLISRNIQLQLNPGSMILIPREQFHQFVVTDKERYTRCILGFGEIPQLQTLIQEVLTEVTVLPHPPESISSIFRTLISAAQKKLPKDEQILLLHSSLAHLLLGQKLFDSEVILRHVSISRLTQETLHYIDAHLAHDLQLNSIARALNVSVSTLSHQFRRDMNISVYRYISEKRLSAVRKYAEQGIPLGVAAMRSGFRDYSGFFRLYKSRYGESPSEASKAPPR